VLSVSVLLALVIVISDGQLMYIAVSEVRYIRFLLAKYLHGCLITYCVFATQGSLINGAYTLGDRRGDWSQRSPVGCLIKQAIVAEMIAATVASCIHYRRSSRRWSPRRSPRVYAL